MNKYIIPSRHTVETFPQVFFKHNVQDCNGIMTDKNDKDIVNQVNKKRQHELFMPIVFATIQIIYWCYIGGLSISANIHHTMSPYPLQHLIALESFDSVVPLKTEHGYNSNFGGRWYLKTWFLHSSGIVIPETPATAGVLSEHKWPLKWLMQGRLEFHFPMFSKRRSHSYTTISDKMVFSHSCTEVRVKTCKGRGSWNNTSKPGVIKKKMFCRPQIYSKFQKYWICT